MAPDRPGSRLPWPKEWRSRRLRSVMVVSVLALLAIASLGRGIAYIAGGNYRGGPLLVALAFVPLALATKAYVTRLRVRDRGVESIHLAHVTELERPAVVIPYAWALGAAAWLGLLALLLVFGIPTFVIGLLLAGSGWRDPGAMVLFVFFSLLILGVLAFLVEILRGGLARGTLALSPTGIYHRSWAFSSYFPWEGARWVVALDFTGPFITMAVFDETNAYYRRTSRLWKQRELLFGPHLAMQGKYLSVDPALAYYALQYYQEHPEARSELGTEAGVERLRRADLLG